MTNYDYIYIKEAINLIFSAGLDGDKKFEENVDKTLDYLKVEKLIDAIELIKK
jgi:hypothetical protein